MLKKDEFVIEMDGLPEPILAAHGLSQAKAQYMRDEAAFFAIIIDPAVSGEFDGRAHLLQHFEESEVSFGCFWPVSQRSAGQR